MSSNYTPNTHTALALDQKAIAGVDEYFAKTKTLVIAGNEYTPAALRAVLQGEVDAIHALGDVQAQMKQQVAVTRKARAQARELRLALKSYILGTYGKAAVKMLQDFGMSVPKPTGRKTVKTKAEALVKAEATRKARHTMGKKQKLAITGETEPPAASPPAPAASSTPPQ